MSYMSADDVEFSGGVVTMPVGPDSVVSPRGLRWPRIDYAHPWNYVPPGHTRSPRGYRRSMNTRGWVPTPGIGAVAYGPEPPPDWGYSMPAKGLSPAPVPVGAPLPKTSDIHPSAPTAWISDLTKIIGAIVPAGATAYSQYQAQRLATKAAKDTPSGMPIAAPPPVYQPAPAGGNTLALVGLGIAGALALVYFMK